MLCSNESYISYQLIKTQYDSCDYLYEEGMV